MREPWRRARLACLLVLVGMGLAGCQSATYVDQYFGTDAGVGFVAPTDASVPTDAAPDGGTPDSSDL